jgi:hypothetical protein
MSQRMGSFCARSLCGVGSERKLSPLKKCGREDIKKRGRSYVDNDILIIADLALNIPLMFFLLHLWETHKMPTLWI